MDEIVKQILAVARATWGKRWLGVGVAVVVAMLAAAGTIMFPERYRASAKVYVDTESVLRPLMTGLAFQPDIDEKVAMLARTLISRPNVERLLQSSRLGVADASSPASLDREVDALLKGIRVERSGNANLYTITYRDKDKARAGHVVAGLVEMFVTSGVGDKKRDSEDARRFLDEQIRVHEAKLVQAEGLLKDFKVKHFGVTGTSNQDHFARMSALTDEVGRLRMDLASAEQARDALRRELAQENPVLPPDAVVPGFQAPPPTETETRLDAQRRQLDELTRRFTDDHPDVVAARRTIARLEEQRQQELKARQVGPDGRPRSLAATSPVYQSIRIQLAQAESRVAELRARLGVLQGTLANVQATVGRVPEVEAQLAQLNRDYEIVRRNYEQLVSRRESAALGERIDETSQVAAFRVVEPARVDPAPVFPNRLMVGVLAFLVSIGAGVGTAFVWTQLVPSFHSVKALAELSGRPVLGTVSMFVGPMARVAERREALRFYAVVTTFVGVHVAWLAWLAMRAKV